MRRSPCESCWPWPVPCWRCRRHSGPRPWRSGSAAAGDGTVRLSFAARPGVCGNGANSITISDGNDDDEWESDCERGPVRVSLRVRSGRCRRRTPTSAAGGAPAPAGTDLGTVPAAGGGRPAGARRAPRARTRARTDHRGHAGGQHGRLAASSRGWPATDVGAARDPEAGRLLARPGRRGGGNARPRLDRGRRPRRHRGARSRRYSPCRSARRTKACRRSSASRARIRAERSGRRRSSGWGRARTPARSTLFEEILSRPPRMARRLYNRLTLFTCPLFPPAAGWHPPPPVADAGRWCRYRVHRLRRDRGRRLARRQPLGGRGSDGRRGRAGGSDSGAKSPRSGEPERGSCGTPRPRSSAPTLSTSATGDCVGRPSGLSRAARADRSRPRTPCGECCPARAMRRAISTWSSPRGRDPMAAAIATPPRSSGSRRTSPGSTPSRDSRRSTWRR